MSSSLWPCGPQPSRLLSPSDFPGKNMGVCCHTVLQGIFPTQWSNPRLLWLLHYGKILHLFHLIWKPLKLVVIIGFFFFYNQSLLIIIQYPLFVVEFTSFTTIHANIIWWALLFVPLSFLLKSVPSYSRISFSIPLSKSKLLWAGNNFFFFLKNNLAVIVEW